MKRFLFVAILVGFGAVAALGGYRYAMHRTMPASGAAPASAGTAAQSDPAAQAGGERKVLYWYDPMFPQQRFDKPGKSPFMDMQLVPKYADEAADGGTVSISPRIVQNLGVRTAQARHGAIEQRFETVGSVAYNERGLVQLQARAAGFVERLYARAPLDPVVKGAPLVEILYPEWAGAQEEYLLLLRHGAPEMKALAEAARQRLALLGMSEPEIAAINREGKARARFTLVAPISGVIAELGIREGMTVMPGMTLFRIVDLSTVWVNAEVPEAQAAWVRPGGRVEARVTGYPETLFKGRVGAILPEVNPATRTLRARIELANPGTRLKPGMYATLSFAGDRSRETLLVPTEAVIRTGTKSVVILALGEGSFRSAEVEVGQQAGGQSEIRKGLKPGDKVVLSGQFLIDSEASLSATVARLEHAAETTQGPQQEEGLHKGRGKVIALDPKNGRVELAHERIPSLQWPPMTMSFVVQDKGQLAVLKRGDAVEFEMRGKPDNGDYAITRIARGGGK
jgi:Cu(I)/Ag(I) efflux system membrane fusion protein